MRPPPPTASLSVLVALLVACSESSSPTRPPEQGTPNFASGATVFSAPIGIGFGGFPDDPLVVLAGFAAGFDADDLCSGNYVFANSSALIVLNPPGGFLAGRGTARDVPVLVYQFADGPLTEDCQLADAHAPLVATGTASFTAPVLLTTGAQVQSWVLRGVVDLVAGGQATLFGTLRFVVRPDGSLLFDNEEVTLTPI